MVRLSALTFCLAAATPIAAQEWQPLFDGTLDGWVKRGGAATYRIEGGAIVGTDCPGRNTFLCTERDYADFELTYEFRAQPGVNSGVQVRSHSRDDYRDGVVHGYQIEIDTSDRAWSGGLYEESVRGWLDNLADNPTARAAFRQGDWNSMRVVCDGPWIRTWINGVPAADHYDAREASGFIGLQVHGRGGADKDPREVRWRNLRIRELGRHEWRPLFDGKTMDGWKATKGGSWSVIDGVLTGTNKKEDPWHGILLSDEQFTDFAIRIQYRALAGNSGLYFRSVPVKGQLGVHGFQSEIDANRDAGMLYETGGRARVQIPSKELHEKAFKQGDWNEMIVMARGRDIAVDVNGIRMTELRNDKGRTKGHFGMQIHGGQDVHVELRAVDVLTRTPQKAKRVRRY